MSTKPQRFMSRLAWSAAVAALLFAAAPANAAEPIKIGLGMSLTGPLAANGKMSLVAMQVWENDINAKGGLLGRPVQLVYYDDQSSPSQVPGIYAKLLDVDKVDLIVSGYASTQIAAAMPVAIQHKKLFVSLFGTGINERFNYPKYFSMIPNGPTPKPAFTRGFFKVAEQQQPKPQTIGTICNLTWRSGMLPGGLVRSWSRPGEQISAGASPHVRLASADGSRLCPQRFRTAPTFGFAATSIHRCETVCRARMDPWR